MCTLLIVGSTLGTQRGGRFLTKNWIPGSQDSSNTSPAFPPLQTWHVSSPFVRSYPGKSSPLKLGCIMPWIHMVDIVASPKSYGMISRTSAIPGQLSPGDGSTTQSPADRPCDGVFFRLSHVISRRESACDLTWVATRGTTKKPSRGLGFHVSCVQPSWRT